MSLPQQQFLYKVWLPGRAPTSGEPSLTLHDTAALKFFVQAGSLLFPDTPFHIVAHYLANELMERPVAEGRFQLHRSIGGRVELLVLEERSIAANGNRKLITSALKAACERKQEQVL